MKHSKMPVIIAILCGSIPLVGWGVSIPYNMRTLGEPFAATGEWNNLPLWIATLPLNRLASLFLSGSNTASYTGIVLYAVCCSILYAIMGTGITVGLSAIRRSLKKASSPPNQQNLSGA